MGVTPRQVLAQIEALAGENEAIVGSNNTTINKHYNWRGAAYCGLTVKYAFEMAGSDLLKSCTGIANVGEFARWAEAQGMRVSSPQAGDIFVEKMGSTENAHMGMVDEILGGGYFLTAEGNYGHVKATKDQAKNGTGTAYEGIGYRKAAVNSTFKFYRPRYDASSGGSTPTPAPTPRTPDKAKVKDWQKFLGVTQDADPGPDTERAAMKKMALALLTQHPMSIGSRGDAVTVLQGLLYAAGYDPKGLDGSYGSGCAAAVKEFEKDHNQTQDGSAGVKVVTALLDEVF